jgi:hypothetical protein
MIFCEIYPGVFSSTTDKIRYVIVNCSIAPKHKYASGTAFYLSVGKIDLMPIGNFWSLEDAKNAAQNVYKLIKELI